MIKIGAITKKDLRYFDFAKHMSEMSNFHQHHIGSVIVYDNKYVLSESFNCTKTHPLQKYYNQFRQENENNTPNFQSKLHSEIRALIPLRHMDIDWDRVSIYNFRCHKSGELALSRPCPACMAALRQIGLRKLYFTNEGSYSYEELIG